MGAEKIKLKLQNNLTVKWLRYCAQKISSHQEGELDSPEMLQISVFEVLFPASSGKKRFLHTFPSLVLLEHKPGRLKGKKEPSIID